MKGSPGRRVWEENVKSAARRTLRGAGEDPHFCPCSLSLLTNFLPTLELQERNFKSNPNALGNEDDICNVSAIQIVTFMFPNQELYIHTQ